MVIFFFNRKYKLTHVVGQGGFGITYKGIWYTEAKGQLGTVNTEVPVCIKEYFFKDYCGRDKETHAVTVHSETGKVLFYKFKEKLIKEAKILSEVNHDHIVRVLDVFEENNTAYIAMEYLDGCSLKYMLEQEGALPEPKVLKYIHQIGNALQFVHEKNILHLDIKPSNILIDHTDTARLIDFGVSKRYDIEEQETSTTMLTLSKGFASIEQYDDEGTQVFSPCPDIYSLGATMYNLLTGKVPTESILRATRVLQKPSELNPAISSKTEDVIWKAMQVIPADRFQSVTDMLAGLDPPPEEQGTPVNTYIENRLFTAEETTLLHSNHSLPGKDPDDEQTIVNPSVEKAQVKKKRKFTWVAVFGTLFVLAASAVTFFVQKNDLENGTGNQEIQFPEGELLAENERETELLLDAIEETETDLPVSQLTLEVQEEAVPVSPDMAPAPVVREAVTSDEINPENNNTFVAPAMDSENADIRYEELIRSGKEKIETGNYQGAQADFVRAKELKITEEVIRLEIDTHERLEMQRIAERRALYEEKIRLGPYIIVRRTSTGKYGAIDEKANEYIPCKYLSVDKAENGRTFEREDSLFDVYSENGSLLSEGVAFY
ncbi:MAG: serine/threonine protein kinase [Tannerellaceae bacterium]|nr:serine/threonine protein kinase [Tannerellaceae bacterium]